MAHGDHCKNCTKIPNFARFRQSKWQNTQFLNLLDASRKVKQRQKTPIQLSCTVYDEKLYFCKHVSYPASLVAISGHLDKVNLNNLVSSLTRQVIGWNTLSCAQSETNGSRLVFAAISGIRNKKHTSAFRIFIRQLWAPCFEFPLENCRIHELQYFRIPLDWKPLPAFRSW